MRTAILVGLGLLLLVLPFLPGLRELRRPKDAEPIRIDESFTRDPRFFGDSLRRKLAPFLEDLPELPARLAVELRRPETLAVYQDLHVPEGAHEDALVVALGAASLGRGARLDETWVRGDAEVGEKAQVRALACDGGVTLGEGARILRWIDVEGHLLAETGADLGLSASASGAVRLSPGCTFRRIWGRPVFVRGETVTPAPDDRLTIEDEVLWGRTRLSLPPGFRLESDVVSLTEVRIGDGALVVGTVKAHGPIVLGEGVRVRGHLISRKEIRIGNGARIFGNVFAERDVDIGSGAHVGRKGGTKTIYAGGRVRIGPGAAVLGWLIAERGGRVE